VILLLRSASEVHACLNSVRASHRPTQASATPASLTHAPVEAQAFKQWGSSESFTLAPLPPSPAGTRAWEMSNAVVGRAERYAGHSSIDSADVSIAHLSASPHRPRHPCATGSAANTDAPYPCQLTALFCVMRQQPGAPDCRDIAATGAQSSNGRQRKYVASGAAGTANAAADTHRSTMPTCCACSLPSTAQVDGAQGPTHTRTH